MVAADLLSRGPLNAVNDSSLFQHVLKAARVVALQASFLRLLLYLKSLNVGFVDHYPFLDFSSHFVFIIRCRRSIQPPRRPHHGPYVWDLGLEGMGPEATSLPRLLYFPANINGMWPKLRFGPPSLVLNFSPPNGCRPLARGQPKFDCEKWSPVLEGILRLHGGVRAVQNSTKRVRLIEPGKGMP